MYSSYISMNRDEVIRRCELVINEINAYRQEEDDQIISSYLARNKYWSFLPWWKPMTKEKAIKRLSSMFFPSISGWENWGETQDLLDAAHASKGTVQVVAGSYILDPKFKINGT